MMRPERRNHPVFSMLADGLLVVVPIGAIVLLVLGIVHQLRDATAPLSREFVHPMVSGVALFIVICFAIGALIRSAVGRIVRQRLEASVFEKLPGYRLAKAFMSDGPLLEAGNRIRPAIASNDDAQSPVLVIDELADGRFVVFVPGSPAPMSGAILIFTPDRIELLDVPLMPFMRAISAWGFGLREAMEGSEPAA